jgi:pSer/pThr/pTyr-binding forkhead associated (FHA) protein
VNDISVSRVHAKIKYRNNQYYIEDNSSKFGSLILVKDKIELEHNHTKAV